MDKLVLLALIVLACVASGALGLTCGKNTVPITESSLLLSSRRIHNYTRRTFNGRVSYQLYNNSPFYLNALKMTVVNVKKVKVAMHTVYATRIFNTTEEFFSFEKGQDPQSVTLIPKNKDNPFSKLAINIRPSGRPESYFHIDGIEACDTRNYRGCYSIPSPFDEKDLIKPASSNMTVQMCRERCFNRRFFAAVSDEKCFCLYRLPGGKLDEDHCNKQCPGTERAEICGGENAMSLFDRSA